MSAITLGDAQKITQILQETNEKMMRPHFGMLRDDQISKKADASVVTIVDKMVEEHLSLLLPRLYPGTDVVGEEAVEQDKTVLKKFSGDKALWILDPLDGTSSFANQKPNWGTLVTYVEEGVPAASWVMNGTTGDYIMVVRGQGAYLNGVRLAPWTNEPRQSLATLRGGKWDRRSPSMTQVHDKNAGHFAALDRNYPTAVTVPFAFQQKGLDFFSSYSSIPWDMLPLVTFVEEMGGKAAHATTGALFRGADLARLRQPTLVTRHADQWEDIRAALYDGIDVNTVGVNE